jgi:hypothetical protein
MTRQRIHVGRDVTLLAEHADGIEVEGAVRLRPGHPVDVGGTTGTTREATVWSWVVCRVGMKGPVFRGVCRWV